MSNLDRQAGELLGLKTFERVGGSMDYITQSGMFERWTPSTDLNQAALVVAEIEKRGLQVAWLHELEASCPILGDNTYDEWEFWLATAPAEARVRAAIACLPKPE